MKRSLPFRIAGLDTLRAVAILSVMLYHLSWMLPPILAPIARFGWMGVDLFFVLSGFLIGQQLLKPLTQGQTISVLTFYRNRSYRILPAYLVVLLFYIRFPLWRESDGMSPLWQFLTFTENLFVNYTVNHNFSHVWSLCVEEHFYLLLPLAILLLARKPSLWLTATVLTLLVLCGVAIRTWELTHVLRPLAVAGQDWDDKYIERIYYPTYARLDGLLAGLTLALIRLFRPNWSALVARFTPWFLLAGLALVGFAMFLFKDRFESLTGPAAAATIIGFPLLSLGLMLITAAAAERRSRLGQIKVPGVAAISTLAYSLYLTHKEVGHLCRHYFPRQTSARDWHSLVILTVSTFTVATLLYVFVERPFLLIRNLHRDTTPSLQARTDPAL